MIGMAKTSATRVEYVQRRNIRRSHAPPHVQLQKCAIGSNLLNVKADRGNGSNDLAKFQFV